MHNKQAEIPTSLTLFTDTCHNKIIFQICTHCGRFFHSR